MPKILITGMSGAGKSTALLELGRRGHRVVDTDYDDWCEWVTEPEQGWVWREERIRELLTNHTIGTLYVQGCVSNQGKFYPQFDAVVLLTAPSEVLFERIATRDTNNYGKSLEEQARIREHIAQVEPLLWKTSTHIINTNCSLLEVVNQLELIAQTINFK
jgi:dephospho-CoA kinase